MARLTGPYEGDPWDRQPEESEKLFARFNNYLDQPPGKRTFTAVAEKHGLEPSTVAEAADRYRWRERAAHYDAHRMRERRAVIAQQEIMLAEQQMVLAGEATEVLRHSIQSIQESGAVLDPKDVPQWARMVETFRRIALDNPDQVVEITGTDGGPIQVEEFEGLSHDQMRDRASEMARSVLRVFEGGKSA